MRLLLNKNCKKLISTMPAAVAMFQGNRYFCHQCFFGPPIVAALVVLGCSRRQYQVLSVPVY